jgi:ATP-dependent Clp protease protease subunit
MTGNGRTLAQIFEVFSQGASRGDPRLTWPFPANMGEWGALMQVLTRRMFLTTPISEKDLDNEIEGVGWLIKGLYTLDSLSHEPITLYINSPGGDISAGMALINVMRDIEAPIVTFVIGEAASMAAVVAVSGRKRVAYPTARWLLHRGKSSASGDATDIEIEAKEFRTVDSYADQVIINASGGKITPKQLGRMQRKNFWMGAEEAKKHGLLDEIVYPKNGWEKWIPEKGQTSFDIDEEESRVPGA